MVDLPDNLKEIMAKPRSGRFTNISIVGYAAIEEHDFKLAKAAANHIIERAETGSGDLVRGLLLLSLAYETEGNHQKSDALIARIIQGEF